MSPLIVDKALNSLVGVGPDTKFANYRRLGLQTHGELKAAFVERARAVGQEVKKLLNADLGNLDAIMDQVPLSQRWKGAEWNKLYPKTMVADELESVHPVDRVVAALALSSEAALAESTFKAEEACLARAQRTEMKAAAALRR